MKSLAIQLLLFLVTIASQAQENATISGYIHEGSSGEPIIGGQVFVPAIRKGAVTNEFGFYSLTIPKGSYQLIYRGAGLPNDTLNIDLTKDTTITSELGKTIQIDEVEINAKTGLGLNFQ